MTGYRFLFFHRWEKVVSSSHFANRILRTIFRLLLLSARILITIKFLNLVKVRDCIRLHVSEAFTTRYGRYTHAESPGISHLLHRWSKNKTEINQLNIFSVLWKMCSISGCSQFWMFQSELACAMFYVKTLQNKKAFQSDAYRCVTRMSSERVAMM